MILKKGSSYPKDEHVVMVRMIAIENILRMSLMYLKKNVKVLRDGMNRNPDKLDQKVVAKHRKTMDSILRGMYPKERIALNNFRQLESWLGHDLLVNALAIDGKTGGVGEGRYRVFEKNIKNKIWKIFETSEVNAGRDKPNRLAKYNDQPKPKIKNRTPKRASPRTKRTKPRGE
jgi:hypothetical protein